MGVPELFVALLAIFWQVLPLVILVFAYRRLGQVHARLTATEQRLAALELRAMAERSDLG